MKTNRKTDRIAKRRPRWRVLLALSMLLATFVAVAPTPALAQSPCGATVTVVYGDTLREIANRCNTTIAAIMAANPEITNRNLIRVGQLLTLPNGNEPSPGVAAVTIQPTSGPPGTTLTVTGQNYPALTELIVGIGEPESEPVSSIRAMSNANGSLTTQVTIPTDAQDNQRFVVVAYAPGQGSARATTQEFVTTSGQDQHGDGRVTIAPTQGPPNAVVRLQATGFAPNSSMEIGFGETESEYNVIARIVTDGNGAIDRQVTI
ncbi:MAG: LysM peptidoglycan-binding domain-containing protein, partial [Caldilineaceae bacterium]|nr:LysM peptidoglycan-binding domain-containing protein [Caldilineaceae bacterium]